MADVNNGANTIPQKCIDISKKFIKAIDKYGIMINLMILQESEPQNQYELLYGQSEPKVATDLQYKALLTMNPPEDTYKDLHLETRGDAILSFMAYSMQLVELIGGTLLDYLNIPKMLIGNHVRIGNDYYRIDEVKQTDVFMGFPLHQICALTFVETKIDEQPDTDDSNEETESGDVDG